eukprot:401186_1
MTQQTFDIIINGLQREIEQKPNNIKSKNPSQIASFIHCIPLNKLIQRIDAFEYNLREEAWESKKKKVKFGAAFSSNYNKDGNQWMGNVTGWNQQEIYQIQAILFRHNVCKDSVHVIKQKLKTIFTSHHNISLKIMDKKFNMEEVVLKMVHNKNIESFSDFVMNMIHDLQNVESKEKGNEIIYQTYQKIGECFKFNYKSLIKKIKNNKYDLLHPTWICRNCSNANVANYINSQIHYDLSIC